MDISSFSGRITELETLSEWLEKQKYRVVAILGMGGVGKTSLSVKLALKLQEEFEIIIWRSLRNAPPISDFLTEMLQFFTPSETTNLPTNLASKISQLLKYFRSNRCLIVLDNWETILRISAGKKRDVAGFYREDYQEYGELLTQLAETSHQSSIVLTSREKPAEIATLEGENLSVRTFWLQGLSQKETRNIFQAKGLVETVVEYDRLAELYQGNPLALKIVTTSIVDIFVG